MTKPIESFHEYVVGDVLGHIDGITSKRMFGGYSLYLDGVISQWFAPKFNERIDRRNKVGPILSISKK